MTHANLQLVDLLLHGVSLFAELGHVEVDGVQTVLQLAQFVLQRARLHHDALVHALRVRLTRVVVVQGLLQRSLLLRYLHLQLPADRERERESK